MICWLGALWRFHGLFANSFHADEALFAGWARLIAVWRDPLLATQAVDKPPLLFYLQALFYPLLGPQETAARLPSFIASLCLIPLTAQLARRLTGDRLAALIAALLVALAPLAIQFSATAFSDPALVFWLMAALYAASAPAGARPRASLAAGLLFGLALATKYQAILFAPLIIGLMALSGRRRADYRRALAGLGLVLLALLLWQAARPAAGGLAALQWANIGGLRLARSWELWPRLGDAARLGWLALGWPLAGAAALAAGSLLLSRRARRQARPAEALMVLFVLGYLLLHWLWSAPVWDRYLLPILPLAAILIGRGLSLLWGVAGQSPGRRPALGVALALLLAAQFVAGGAARQGRFPLGGQPGADGGAANVARLLNDAPYGTVLYDHWYSWQWRYHLFDKRVYVSWFPHADALLADLQAFAGRGPDRFIVLPAAGEARPVVRRLHESGYRLEAIPGADGASITLYRIVVEGQG